MKSGSAALGNPFQSLLDGNYRVYWFSMCLSSLAIWVQNAVQPWLAYSMTDSPALLGVVSALQFTPIFLLSPVVGALIDCFSKRTLMLCTQAGFLLISLLMAALVISDHINFGLVVLIAVLTGLNNVVNLPLRQVWISSLVRKDLLVNAVGLYSLAFNLARIVGPAAAGFLMDGYGLGCCYLINAVLFLCALIGIAFVKAEEKSVPGKVSLKTIWTEMRSGVRYAAERKNILFTLLELGVTGIFSINFSVLLPVLAVEVLSKGEMGFGVLMSMVGIGSFLGAFIVASCSKKGPKAFFLRSSPVLLAAAWVVIAAFDGPIIYVMLVISGFFYVSYSSTANVALQLWSDPNYAGRMVSFYSLVIAGSSPIGNLYSGVLSDRFGVRAGCAACGVTALICLAILRRNAGNRAPRG